MNAKHPSYSFTDDLFADIKTIVAEPADEADEAN
jgi:hypothetical protein